MKWFIAKEVEFRRNKVIFMRHDNNLVSAAEYLTFPKKVCACHLMVLAGLCLGPGLRRREWMDLWTLDTRGGNRRGGRRERWEKDRGGWDAKLSGILLYWTPRGAFKISFNCKSTNAQGIFTFWIIFYVCLFFLCWSWPCARSCI